MTLFTEVIDGYITHKRRPTENHMPGRLTTEQQNTVSDNHENRLGHAVGLMHTLTPHASSFSAEVHSK
jgi:hypothetical protein